jgi:hypothetical protein
MRTTVLALAVIAFAAACTPPAPPKPPPPDAFDETPADAGVAEDIAPGSEGAKSPVGQACTTLATLGCIEGLKRDAGDTCAMAINHIIDEHLTKFDVRCVIAAKSQAAVRLCAGASCTLAK